MVRAGRPWGLWPADGVRVLRPGPIYTGECMVIGVPRFHRWHLGIRQFLDQFGNALPEGHSSGEALIKIFAYSKSREQHTSHYSNPDTDHWPLRPTHMV